MEQPCWPGTQALLALRPLGWSLFHMWLPARSGSCVITCGHMWVCPVPRHRATSGDPESTGPPDLPFLCGGLGVPTCSPFSMPSPWSPRPPSTHSRQVQTCDWPVVDGPANAGGGAAPGSTTKPQPVPEVQASVPRQGGEDGQRQDGEVRAAAGAAHGVLSRADVGSSIPSLRAQGRADLRHAPPQPGPQCSWDPFAYRFP